MDSTRRPLPVTLAGLVGLVVVTTLIAGCGGSSSDSTDASLDDASGAPADDPAGDVDLSFDLDELDEGVAADQAELDDVDLSQGFQCPAISNQVVDDLTDVQVAGVREGADGCIFTFGFSDLDPLRIDSYTDDIFVGDARASADLLLASTGGRSVAVPNALSAHVFEGGFTRDNLPVPPDDGSLGPGRQVIGYFMGTRGVRLIAVFPDAIVGMYDGSDAVADPTERAALFERLMAETVYAA